MYSVTEQTFAPLVTIIDLPKWLRLTGNSVVTPLQIEFVRDDLTDIFSDLYEGENHPVSVIGTCISYGVSHPVMELTITPYELTITLLFCNGSWAVSVDSKQPLEISKEVFMPLYEEQSLFFCMPENKRFSRYSQYSNKKFSFLTDSLGLKKVLEEIRDNFA